MGIVFDCDRKFDWTVPVLVVGAGACGLVAALAARESGVEVLVLERDKTPSGSTGMSYGAICAAGSRIQQAAGIDDTPDMLFEDIMARTRGQTDPDLAHLIAHESAPAIDWLTGTHGLQLSLEPAWVGLGHRHPRLHAPHDRSGESLMGMLLRATEQAGVNLATRARVVALIADENRSVLGVRVERPDGSLEEIGCRALVLATCGFGANREMVAHCIPEMSKARYFGHEGNQGDGIRWGEELGGMTADMGSYQALGSLAHPQALVMPHTLLIGGGVQVNTNGQRFENELEDISGQSLTILGQPDGVCWMVYDQRLHDDALARFREYRQGAEMNVVRQANSWRELAEKMAVPAEELEQTMQQVEEWCRRDAVDGWGRRFDKPSTLKPPCFAVRVTAALFHTQGGLVVDRNAQVRTQTGKCLSNVFAGGGTARSVSGPGGWGYLPAMGLCTAVTLGRVAGQSAARLAQAS